MSPLRMALAAVICFCLSGRCASVTGRLPHNFAIRVREDGSFGGKEEKDNEDVKTRDLSRVAVCVSGQLRTWGMKETQDRLVQNFHQEGYEYFLSVDEAVDLGNANINELIRSAIKTVNITAPAMLTSTDCPEHTSMHKHLWPMASRMSICLPEIAHQEKTRDFTYSYVIRTRPDLAYVTRLPHASDMTNWGSQYNRDLILCDDLFAVGPRVEAKTMLLYPTKAYSECHNATRWSWACGHKVDKDPASYYAGVPCCPMNMISWYDHSRIWNMAWPLYVQNQTINGGPLPSCSLSIQRTNKVDCPPLSCR